MAGGAVVRVNVWARFVLVVEKDAVFQRLAEERIDTLLPCIVITGRGFPDTATRAFLFNLVRCFPDLEVLALVDLDPDGVQILLHYKYGIGKTLDRAKYAVPSLQWLGMHRVDLGSSTSCLMPLTRRERTLSTKLLARSDLPPTWRDEIAAMLKNNSKAEIEGVYENITQQGTHTKALVEAPPLANMVTAKANPPTSHTHSHFAQLVVHKVLHRQAPL